MTIYCANDCDNEAVAVVLHEDGSATPLCYTCKTAYEWGAAAADADIQDINGLDVKLEKNPDGSWRWCDKATTNDVVIEVRGGFAELVSKPPYISVNIIDHDDSSEEFHPATARREVAVLVVDSDGGTDVRAFESYELMVRTYANEIRGLWKPQYGPCPDDDEQAITTYFNHVPEEWHVKSVYEIQKEGEHNIDE